MPNRKPIPKSKQAGGPDARQHQQLRRTQRARAEDHLAIGEDHGVAGGGGDLDAGRPPPLEHDAGDRRSQPDSREPGVPLPAQVSRAARAAAPALRDMQVARSLRRSRVEIIGPLDPELFTPAQERIGQRCRMA